MNRAFTAGMTAVAIAIGCGGQIFGNPPGYLDDAGNFHAPDGGLEFGPGTACKSYDPSTFLSAPHVPCTSENDCDVFIAQHIPPNYSFYAVGCDAKAGCLFWAGTDDSFEHAPPDKRMPCTPGSEGNAYCTTYFSQFVIGDASVNAICNAECELEVNPDNWQDPEVCKPGTGGSYCLELGNRSLDCSCLPALCVSRGDGVDDAGSPLTHCEVPCALPPDDAAGGGDP